MPECYILRGPSGSGKTTLSKILCSMPDVIDVSADDFFIESDGVYRFNKKELGMAHWLCQEQFAEIVKEGKYSVVVDNTNTTISEWTLYKNYAEQHGYTVFLLDVNPHTNTADLFKRNIHGVPFETIVRMKNRIRQNG